jgi:hypothetical protein
MTSAKRVRIVMEVDGEFVVQMVMSDAFFAAPGQHKEVRAFDHRTKTSDLVYYKRELLSRDLPTFSVFSANYLDNYDTRYAVGHRQLFSEYYPEAPWVDRPEAVELLQDDYESFDPPRFVRKEDAGVLVEPCSGEVNADGYRIRPIYLDMAKIKAMLKSGRYVQTMKIRGMRAMASVELGNLVTLTTGRKAVRGIHEIVKTVGGKWVTTRSATAFSWFGRALYFSTDVHQEMASFDPYENLDSLGIGNYDVSRLLTRTLRNADPMVVSASVRDAIDRGEMLFQQKIRALDEMSIAGASDFEVNAEGRIVVTSWGLASRDKWLSNEAGVQALIDDPETSNPRLRFALRSHLAKAKFAKQLHEDRDTLIYSALLQALGTSPERVGRTQRIWAERVGRAVPTEQEITEVRNRYASLRPPANPAPAAAQEEAARIEATLIELAGELIEAEAETDE